MEEFLTELKQHTEHIKKVGEHCTTEETTKQALILPMLDILGFCPYDPTKVIAEYQADFPGAKSAERVDYALFCHESLVMLIEAKPFSEKLGGHSPQLSRYFNALPDVAIGIITNGREWRFFTDLARKNVMDTKPFLSVNLLAADESDLKRFAAFCYDKFEPEKLRQVAEESSYLQLFTAVVNESLRTVPLDFVRYVAGKSNLSRQLTAKFLESITPIVRTAVSKAVSDTVVSGLSSPAVLESETDEEAVPWEERDDINPDNEKIVTTVKEKRLYILLTNLLGDNADIALKDTESYCAYLYQNKTNRWLLRYYGDRQHPAIETVLPMTEARTKEAQRSGLSVQSNGWILLDKPEDIYRIAGIIFDCYEYCKNDENYRVKLKTPTK